MMIRSDTCRDPRNEYQPQAVLQHYVTQNELTKPLQSSEVCVWKDPVVAQQRTKSIRLLHKQLCKDSNLSGQGRVDYIVTFRKPGDNESAITGELERYVGDAVDVSPAAYERQAAELRAVGKEPWPYLRQIAYGNKRAGLNGADIEKITDGRCTRRHLRPDDCAHLARTGHPRPARGGVT